MFNFVPLKFSWSVNEKKTRLEQHQGLKHSEKYVSLMTTNNIWTVLYFFAAETCLLLSFTNRKKGPSEPGTKGRVCLELNHRSCGKIELSAVNLLQRSKTTRTEAEMIFRKNNVKATK